MNKKGQTEIIGLMVIIILIIIIFLLYIRFSLINEEGLVTGNVELSSMLNAVLKYDTPEGSIKQIIIYCEGGNLVGEDDACVYLDKKIEIIMGKIVDVEDWNIKIFEGESVVKQIGNDCSGSNLVSNQNIAGQGINLVVQLEKCKKK